MAAVDNIFDIIAEEVGVERDELASDSEFADFGIDKLLATSILSRIAKELGINLPATTFEDHETAVDLQAFLHKQPGPQSGPQTDAMTLSSVPASAGPVSFILQGKPQACAKTLFLLPDGGGSGMAYARLPQIDPSVCLIVLNSPYLKAPTTACFTVEGIAALWAAEIQLRQPHGPYYLGGWSSGGYYSFEVTKVLTGKGERVDKLIILDTPCRLVYEALPMEVVNYLSNNDMMGNWGNKKPPEWMTNHFDITIKAIGKYFPTPFQGPGSPDVHVIWAEDGVLEGAEKRETGLNMDIKVTRMLLERPRDDGAQGWDRLFPGATVDVATMPGNHFTMVYPPNCSSLSVLLGDVVGERTKVRRGKWKRAQ